MEFSSIVIIGLGFMGGSLAMAIKKAGFKGIVVGVARNEDNLRRAKERGIIDEYKTSPQEGVGDSDLVILSTGIGSFKNILRSIRDRLKKGTIVSDIGSVKGELVEQMESMMPEGVSFVGAHPIAGSERKGVDEAFPELYRGCKCIITPTDKTDEDALRKIEDFWRFIGAEPVEMDCYEHDRIFAALSHFPHVLAYALVNTIISFDRDIIRYSGSGFRDTTRIAMSPPDLWTDICMHNRENILKMIELFESSLSIIKEKIEHSDWEGLEREFERASKVRKELK